MTDIYVGQYRQALTLNRGSVALTSAAANSALKFDLSTLAGSGGGYIYLGFLFVGTTAPSLWGQNIPQELSNHTPIYAATSSTAQPPSPARPAR